MGKFLEKWWVLLLLGALAVIGLLVVGYAHAADDNWARREPGDQRGWCAGRYDARRGSNFGPCPGYYTWTKFGAGGPYRDYTERDRQGGGDAAVGVSASAPAAPAPAASPSPGGHGHGGHGHGGHGGGKGR